jgi:hypothetical protein
MEKVARVFGRASFIISVECDEDETIGLLDVNYRFNSERFIAYRLTAIDGKGNEHTITVHDCDDMELEEFIG